MNSGLFSRLLWFALTVVRQTTGLKAPEKQGLGSNQTLERLISGVKANELTT